MTSVKDSSFVVFEFSPTRALRTTELYQSAWGDWERFCATIDANPLPAAAETVLAFLHAREATHSTAALGARLSAIRAAHKDMRGQVAKAKRRLYALDSDESLETGWKAILRRKGNRHTPREAVGGAQLKRLLRQIPRTLAGTMDTAILLVGLACAMRRSEIAALNRDDIEFTEDAMLVHIRRSKTDQSGAGVTLAAARTGTEACPVAAMERWVAEGDVVDGPLFRHPKFKNGRRICDEYTYLLVKKYGKMAGLDARKLGAHSLRRGCITEIHEAGIDAKSGMSHSRHVTPGVYYGYVAGKTASKNPAIHALARSL